MINGSVHPEEIITLNLNETNTTLSKYMKQKLIELKEEINRSSVTVGDSNTHARIDGISRKTIRKDIDVLNNTVSQRDFIDIYRTFYSTIAEYAFFSSTLGTFADSHHVLMCKTSLIKFKMMEILQSIFCGHSITKLEINIRKIV